MKDTSKKEMSPMLKGLYKMAILAIIVGSVIAYSDLKGYFNPDVANDHTKRKWDTFYDMHERGIHIDVMLFGNSHLYTGVNPKNLSLALGTNAFIFASPGTITVDNYYAMKEAIKVQKPSLVILETYGLNDMVPKELVKGPLSNQIVSFSARKDFVTKLSSTPALFALDNYLYSWSTTIRNHDYLFTNSEQLKTNRQIIASHNPSLNNQGLYLGRYVRFTSGLEEDVLSQYKENGAPVDGAAFEYSKENAKYTQKIIDLCKEENVKLMFLTLPMYEEHVSNYSDWNESLAKLIEPSGTPWLNLQMGSDYEGFGKFAFENTYKPSQHMTYNGSILVSYKLVNFILEEFEGLIPSQKKDVAWHQLYYGGEGYFENYSPANNDGNNKLVAAAIDLQNAKLNSLSSIVVNNGASRKLMAKIDKSSIPSNVKLEDYKLVLAVDYNTGGQQQTVNVELKYDKLYQLPKEALFTTAISNVDLVNVVDGALSPR